MGSGTQWRPSVVEVAATGADPPSQNIRDGLFTHLHEQTAEAQSNSQQAERRATLLNAPVSHRRDKQTGYNTHFRPDMAKGGIKEKYLILLPF